METCTDNDRKIVQEIESREKCLCILVNNAGIAPEKTETSHETPEEMRENLLGPTSSVFICMIICQYIS